MHCRRSPCLLFLLVSLGCSGDGGGGTDDTAPTDGGDCSTIPTEGPAWSATVSGAESEELGAEGNAAGFWGVGVPTDDIGNISLVESGRAEVLLFVPAELLTDGGTFDLGEALPDVSDNALLLAEYDAPVRGEVVVCPGPDGQVSGSFDATGTSVIDDEEATVRGTFSGLVVAE